MLLTFILSWLIVSIIGLVVMIIGIYIERKTNPLDYDNNCSKIDHELNEQGK